LVIPGLTEFIISNLRPDENGTTEAHQDTLPQEIVDIIMDSATPFHHPPLECSRILAQSRWLEGLINGRLLPFLWDLDPESCLPQADEIFNMDWDYELLVRQLAQVEFFELVSKSGKNVPLGLRNRRRIWRLVEEMYVGDINSSSIH
jgi:hypothetical protein